MVRGEIAKGVIINAINREDDPDKRHWAELFVLEIDRIDSDITTMKDTLTDLQDVLRALRDQVTDTDHEHDLSIRSLEIRTGLISGGAGSIVTLILNAVIYYLQNH